MTTILEKTAGLVAFVRTVDSGSFSGAGRFVGSSPSAVSKSVARLERRLGIRLLQRSTRTLSLTAEGAAYYDRVAPLLRAIEDAEDIVLELSVTDRHVDLIREGFDVAIRIGQLADTELTARKLADLPTVPIASPSYLARRA
jgi:DNA-binding transcriptional LysR family regulator